MILAYNERSTTTLDATLCPSPHQIVGGDHGMAIHKPIPSLTASRTAEFWTLVDKNHPSGCWVWGGSKSKGYGSFYIRGHKNLRVHRIAYTLLKGPIPVGLTIDHLCRNRACCNPDHLEPVTNRENVLRGVGVTAVHARQTHCVNGHPFTPENTRPHWRGGRRGHGRSCAQCERDSQKKRAAQRRHVAQMLKEERRASGLCVQCGKPAVAGRRHCEPCRERVNTWQRRARAGQAPS